jgi:uncharacterized RDD family membrane protein YckC
MLAWIAARCLDTSRQRPSAIVAMIFSKLNRPIRSRCLAYRNQPQSDRLLASPAAATGTSTPRARASCRTRCWRCSSSAPGRCMRRSPGAPPAGRRTRGWTSRRDCGRDGGEQPKSNDQPYAILAIVQGRVVGFRLQPDPTICNWDLRMGRPGKPSGSNPKSPQEPTQNSRIGDVWYYISHSGQFGPYSIQDLKAELATIPDTKNLFVWCDGMTDWQKASAVPELNEPENAPSAKEGCHDAHNMGYVEPRFAEGPNCTGRRIAAFIIDVIIANCIAFSVPWAIAEITDGRYRLTSAPGLYFTFCTPVTSETVATIEIKERALRSPPPFKKFIRTEYCTARLNLILRSPFVTALFQPDNSPGLLTYSLLLDFDGKEAITPLNQYAFYFVILFFVAFLMAAWLDSLGARMLGIRIRTLDGAKLRYPAFLIRYAIIAIVFAPLFLISTYGLLLSIGLTLTLVAICLFPWFKGDFRYRRGLQDVFAGTMVIRALQVRATA